MSRAWTILSVGVSVAAFLVLAVLMSPCQGRRGELDSTAAGRGPGPIAIIRPAAGESVHGRTVRFEIEASPTSNPVLARIEVDEHPAFPEPDGRVYVVLRHYAHVGPTTAQVKYWEVNSTDNKIQVKHRFSIRRSSLQEKILKDLADELREAGPDPPIRLVARACSHTDMNLWPHLEPVLLRSRGYHVRRQIQAWVGHLKHVEAVPALISELNDEDDVVAFYAKEELRGIIGDIAFQTASSQADGTSRSLRQRLLAWFQTEEPALRARLGQPQR